MGDSRILLSREIGSLLERGCNWGAAGLWRARLPQGLTRRGQQLTIPQGQWEPWKFGDVLLTSTASLRLLQHFWATVLRCQKDSQHDMDTNGRRPFTSELTVRNGENLGNFGDLIPYPCSPCWMENHRGL
jgi:hypothetical protein